MNKAHVSHLLSDYLEGSLPPGGAEKVKAHLAFCNACRQALADTEHHMRKLRATPAARVPSGLEARVLTAIREERDQPLAIPEGRASMLPSWLSPLKLIVFLAACAALVFAVRELPTDFFSRPDTPAPTPVAPTPAPVAPEAPAAPVLVVASSEAAPAASLTQGTTVEAAQAAPAIKEEGVPPVAVLPREPEAVAKAKEPAKAPAIKEAVVLPPVPAPAVARPTVAPTAAPITAPAAPVAPAAAAAPEVPSSPPPTLPQSGTRSLIETAVEKVLSTEGQWQELWARHTGGGQSRPPVDFDTQQIIALFAGPQPTPGYGLEIVEIKNTSWNGDAARIVRYRITPPPAGAVAAQVITYPYLLKTEPKFGGQTFFEKIP